MNRVRSVPRAHLAAAAQHPALFWAAADGGGGDWDRALARARACAVALAPLLSAVCPLFRPA
jgi:hypothetical protein